jgi:uncharacterized protein YdhG (YjbR/CyaY superfamily)
MAARGDPGSAAKSSRVGAPSVDDYLAGLPPDQRAALEDLRTTIRAAAPGAEELIAYQIPAYKQRGMLVSFSAHASHCTFHVMSPETLRAHAADVKGFDTTTGGIHFTPDKPLPAELVMNLVKARLAENEQRAKN